VSDERAPIGDPDDPTADSPDSADFAAEHDDTAVDKDVTSGRDSGDREPESPSGWSGLES
jgi:hypothetical protein